ncbi:ciliogenesis-associated TTC17-interacting protein-like isoform X2 [Rhopilema esculentum]|uniref:ciliogenesis-associated TTC17-interacting protein-like isoform X2 n=1 Tax=Rhopilema esculentum TaxID=499914 RepID=UPI0031E0685B
MDNSEELNSINMESQENDIENQENKEDDSPKANKAALNYLESIDFKTLGKTVFTDFLGTVSDNGKEIGEVTVTVEETTRGGEICYLVHAHSHGVIDSVQCGTSVTAYVGRGLVTLEETKHEYMKVPKKPRDRKTILLKQGGQFLLKRITTEGEDHQEDEKTFSATNMKGFISEGSNVILQRVIAIKQLVPQEDAEFIALDSEMKTCICTYARLEDKTQTIEDQTVEMFGVERSVLSSASESVCRSYFLRDGHLSFRSTQGYPATMRLLRLPRPEEEEEQKTTIQRKTHRWEEDMQFWSRFLDRKEELKSDHLTFIQKHPELKALMSDFLQFLLLRKPEDICSFAANYFEAFSTVAPATMNSNVR